ncbi:MAG TPA: hypothetical protein VGQ23_15190 [Burkholderiaceae bacterium]|nr:hypothetical protein [Burkholderiaceae bacterium]
MIGPLRRALLDRITEPDHAYDTPADELLPLQLAAAQELFTERVGQIPLLRKRAEDAGISAIREPADLLPLLFAHTVYKSYPASFVEQGRWDRMLQWLQTLSVADVRNVDVQGVTDVDGFLERLWAAGHGVLATSGSGGKCSFLNHTPGDRELKARHFKHTTAWPFARSAPERPLFWLGPIQGFNSAVESAQINRVNWGRPGAMHALKAPLRMGDVNRAIAMRKCMADGSATPREIAAFEAEAADKSRQAQAELHELADRLLDHRHEPIMLSGMWAQHMVILQRARERGIADGDFHPQSIVMAGGGVKGIPLPPDYKAQVDRFYGNVIRPGAYGMTELAQLMPRCEAGRYHRAPGLVWLVSDERGERLLTKERDADAQGHASGRFAFLDLIHEGRWGGLISGDKVTIDFSERCPCGRHGPTLLDTITRYAATGDDNIGCAGTIDAYIRGAIES